MTAPEYGMVFIAAPPDRAEEIARSAVERRLAACAQVTGPVTSHYRWKGALHREEERLILLKSSRDQLDGVQRLLSEIHPYEVPECLFLPVAGGSPTYLAWMAGELSAAE